MGERNWTCHDDGPSAFQGFTALSALVVYDTLASSETNPGFGKESMRCVAFVGVPRTSAEAKTLSGLARDVDGSP